VHGQSLSFFYVFHMSETETMCKRGDFFVYQSAEWPFTIGFVEQFCSCVSRRGSNWSQSCNLGFLSLQQYVVFLFVSYVDFYADWRCVTHETTFPCTINYDWFTWCWSRCDLPVIVDTVYDFLTLK